MKVATSLKLSAFAIALTLAGSANADCIKTADKILGGKSFGLSEKIGTFSARKSEVKTTNNGNTLSKGGDTVTLNEKKDGTTVIAFAGGRDFMAERKDYTFTLNKTCKITEISGITGVSQEKFKITPAVCALPKIDELSKKSGEALDSSDRPKTKQVATNGGVMPEQDWGIVPRTCGKYREMFAATKDNKPVGTVKDKNSTGGGSNTKSIK